MFDSLVIRVGSQKLEKKKKKKNKKKGGYLNGVLDFDMNHVSFFC